jgi:hypothetical protein
MEILRRGKRIVDEGVHGNLKELLNPYPANVENMVISNNTSKWLMGFNSAFKGLICECVNLTVNTFNNRKSNAVSCFRFLSTSNSN